MRLNYIGTYRAMINLSCLSFIICYLFVFCRDIQSPKIASESSWLQLIFDLHFIFTLIPVGVQLDNAVDKDLEPEPVIDIASSVTVLLCTCLRYYLILNHKQ